MKKRMVSIGLVLMVSFLLTSIVGAQPSSYSSGVQIANLDDSNTANIIVSYYNQDGSVNTTVNDQIQPGKSVTYYPLQTSAGFNGSAVVSADRPIAAIVNVVADNFLFGASYDSFSEGASEVSLPLIMKGNGGFSTWFNVQNAGSAPTDVTVSYAGTSCTENGTIQPGAAKSFDQSGNSCLSNGYVGAATVTTANASEKVVATVMEVGSNTLFAYNGFTSGSTNPVMPLVNANNGGYVTGIALQNTGNSATTVTVSYVPSAAGTACTQTRTIPAKSFGSFAFNAFSSNGDKGTTNCVHGQKFVGSASVTANSSNHELVGIVNQLNFSANKAAAYNAFDTNLATSKVVAPLIMDRNAGYYTGINVQNVGASAANITCTFSNSDGSITETYNQNVAPGSALSHIQLNFIANGFVGSGVCEASGASLIGSVNELGSGTGDQLFAYEMINN